MNISFQYNFKPFDMTPILNAMTLYNTLYEKEQQMYDTLSLKLGDLSSAVEGTTLAKGIYDKYMEQLNQAASDFGVGRNQGTARLLSNLRRMYGTDIRLLELARDKMLSVVDMRSKIAAAGLSGDMIYQDMGNLDTYLLDPNYTPQAYSKDKLTSDTATMIKAMTLDIVNLDAKDALDKYHKILIELSGLTSAQAVLAIQEIQSSRGSSLGERSISDSIINGVANQVFNASGIGRWGTQNNVDDAWDAISKGISMGVGAVRKSAMRDLGVLTELERRADDRAAALLRIAQAEEARNALKFDILMQANGYEYNPATKKYELTAGDVSTAQTRTLPDGTQLVQDPNNKNTWHAVGADGKPDPTKDNGGTGWTDANIRSAWAKAKQSGSGRGSGSVQTARIKNPYIINMDDNNRSRFIKFDDLSDYEGTTVSYGELTEEEKKQVDKVIKDDNPDAYTYQKVKEDKYFWGTGDYNTILITPSASTKATSDTETGGEAFDPNKV